MGRRKGHIPMRTCVSCKIKRRKKELIRIVLDAQGRVVRDKNGKRPGRGAYVCESRSCLERLVKGNILAKAFREEGSITIHPSLEAEKSDQAGGIAFF
jgi:predicted RNA-binding protein YlxR (DUF448 family)